MTLSESQYCDKYFVRIILILKIRKPKLTEVTIIEEVNVNTTAVLIKTERPINLLSQLVEIMSLYFFYLYSISFTCNEKYM